MILFGWPGHFNETTHKSYYIGLCVLHNIEILGKHPGGVLREVKGTGMCRP